MKNKRVLVSLIALCLLATAIFSACSSQPDTAFVKETRTFTDSAGREVEVPENIEKVAVSGALAQIYVFSICPDLLCGLASSWSDEAKEYIDPKYHDLPALGQFYGSKGDLNTETIMSTGAEIIIDVGETKSDIESDMDDIQEQTGIPTVHIAADLDTTGDAFRMLGDLLGMEDEAEELAAFYEETYDNIYELSENVDKVDLLYLSGDLGQNVLAKGSYHAEVIDMLANNIAEVDNPSSKGNGNEVDMEQILNWDPDVIIFAPQSLFSYVSDETEWQELKAIKNNEYYETPFGPHNWMGQPPSCQRLLGMMWLAKLLYPDEADYDLREEVQEYYRLFYHKELSDEQYDSLVENSMIKAESNR